MIMRTIITTIAKIKEAKVVDGKLKEVDLPDVIIRGKASETKIRRYIKELYGNRTIFILKIYEEKNKYKMTVADFVKYGTKY